MFLSDEALKSMHVMIATPCYISAVSMNYVTSIFDLTWHCARFGLKCILHMHSESLITRSRNKIVRDFLADGSLTHLFFIDSDIEFAPQAVFRLLLADRDICAGVYPMKTFNWPVNGVPAGMTYDEFRLLTTEYPFNLPQNETRNALECADDDGFAEVAEAPSGFMCIKRHVFYEMMKAHPDLQYTPDGPAPQPLAHLYWRFFDCMVDPETNRYLSEDFAFCRLWRGMGRKVYVDLNSKFGHIGQYMFRGDLSESLRRRGR